MFLENADAAISRYESEELIVAARIPAITSPARIGGRRLVASKINTFSAADVLHGNEAGPALVQMRGRFRAGDTLEVLSPSGSFGAAFSVQGMTDEEGSPVEDAKRVLQKLRLPAPVPLHAGDILRRVPSTKG